MGTNYYFEYGKCECCERFDRLHIGKSSGGWEFSFRGYKDSDWLTELKEGKPSILSYKDWLTFFETHPGKIVDEYGSDVAIEGFKELVKNKKGGINHGDYCKEHHPDHAERDCWADDEGNSMQDCEFS